MQRNATFCSRKSTKKERNAHTRLAKSIKKSVKNEDFANFSLLRRAKNGKFAPDTSIVR